MCNIELVCFVVPSVGMLVLTPDGFAFVANLGPLAMRAEALALLVVSSRRSRGDQP